MNTRFVSICICAFFSLLSSKQSASALQVVETDKAESEVNRLSSDLLNKEIELLKLNTRLKLFMQPRSPWSARRQSGLGFTNATLTAIGAFANGSGRLHYLDKPKRAPRPLFEDAAIVRFLANSITTGAQLVELCNDTITDIKDRRSGVSLPLMRKQALSIQHDIDTLIEARENAVASCEHEQRHVLDKEETVIRDLRNVAANEFALYYAEAKGNRFSRRLGYAISLTSNIASGAGTLVGIEASRIRRLKSVRKNHMGGVGAITDIVTGSINILTPFALRGGQMLQSRLARNKICDELNCKQSEKLETLAQDEREFEEMISSKPEFELHGVRLRRAAFKTASEILKKRAEMLVGERRSAKARFYENVAVATVAGSSKITNGVGGVVGAFKYPKDAYHRFEVQGATALVYGTGNALAALETARVRLGEEFKLLEAKKKPGKKEILNSQLKQLEDLQHGTQLAGKPAGQSI